MEEKRKKGNDIMSISMKDTLANYYVEYGIKKECPCFESEKSIIAKMLSDSVSLGDEIYQYRNTKKHGKYYKLKSILSPDETLDYLTFKQIDLLKTIKNCLVFFVTIIVIGLFAGLLILLFYLVTNRLL